MSQINKRVYSVENNLHIFKNKKLELYLISYIKTNSKRIIFKYFKKILKNN